MSGRSRWIARVSAVTGILLVLGVTVAPSAQAANRNILVHFTNSSDSALTLSSVTLDGGCALQRLKPQPRAQPHSLSCVRLSKSAAA